MRDSAVASLSRFVSLIGWPCAMSSQASSTTRHSSASALRTSRGTQRSPAGVGRRRWTTRWWSGYRSRRLRPTALSTSQIGHPAKQCTSTRPSLASLIERLGERSSWAGQRASHRLAPVARTSVRRSSSRCEERACGVVTCMAGCSQVVRHTRGVYEATRDRCTDTHSTFRTALVIPLFKSEATSRTHAAIAVFIIGGRASALAIAGRLNQVENRPFCAARVSTEFSTKLIPNWFSCATEPVTARTVSRGNEGAAPLSGSLGPSIRVPWAQKE